MSVTAIVTLITALLSSIPIFYKMFHKTAAEEEEKNDQDAKDELDKLNSGRP